LLFSKLTRLFIVELVNDIVYKDSIFNNGNTFNVHDSNRIIFNEGRRDFDKFYKFWIYAQLIEISDKDLSLSKGKEAITSQPDNYIFYNWSSEEFYS